MRLAAFGRRTFFALLPVPAIAQGQRPGAGVLVVGQASAQAFAADGGLARLAEGLGGLLGVPPTRFEPGAGLRRLPAFALPAGLVRDPPAFTTAPVPLWEPGNPRAFLVHRAEEDPLQWQRGAAGEALGRFVRSVMSTDDRARCLGILWLHGAGDSPPLTLGDIFTQAQAMRRQLILLRADFGRPASGPGALPAFFWAPPPAGPPDDAQRLLRQAMSEVMVDSEMNASMAMPQTADCDLRGEGQAALPEPADLALFGRRAAFAIARALDGPARFPGLGPRIIGVEATNFVTTEVLVAFDRGASLKLNGLAGDGRGWTVRTLGETRNVHSIQRSGPSRLILRHQYAAPRRMIGYCLFGERIGRGNAITDDWASRGEPPPGLGPEWLIDLPLQASITPWFSE